MIKQNLHTHTTYCDGKNTCEEIIISAIDKGFESIGFSGHAYTPKDTSYCMTEENTINYHMEIDRLKTKYRDKIKIYKGIEADLYSSYEACDFDYTIGSVHYIEKNGELLPVDESKEVTNYIIKKYFQDNAMAYAKAYFDEVIKLSLTKKFDILGHFDLVCKFSKDIAALDTNSNEYLTYALDALKIISEKVRMFEVNTGGMARGYTQSPYPMKNILMSMRTLGMEPIITSDCHDKDMLDYEFSKATAILKACGFEHTMYLSPSGFIKQKL